MIYSMNSVTDPTGLVNLTRTQWLLEQEQLNKESRPGAPNIFIIYLAYVQ